MTDLASLQGMQPEFSSDNSRRMIQCETGMEMRVCQVRVTWREDETQASEESYVTSESMHDAIREAVTRVRFQPHHEEAQFPADSEAVPLLKPGEIRRVQN